MRRREFISLLGGVAAACPLGARAQQPAMPVVGFINGAFPAPRNFAAFVQGLKEARFVVDSQNVLIEARWAEGNYARLPAIVDELIGRDPALIATTGGLDPARAAKAATTTIPIVFVIGGGPVKLALLCCLESSSLRAFSFRLTKSCVSETGSTFNTRDFVKASSDSLA